MFVEEATPTTIGAFEGDTAIPAADSIKVLASELLKSKVPKLPCPKYKDNPQKDCASKMIKIRCRIHFSTLLVSNNFISIFYFK